MRLILILISIPTLSLPACAPGAAPAGGPVRVVAAFYPLEEAAVRAGGPGADVRNLTPPGTEPHDLELSTRDLDLLLDADLVVYVGGGFQPAVEDAVAGRDGTSLDALADGGATEDPHVWLDPARMASIALRVGEALGEADPGDREGYAARAGAYAEELRALDEELGGGLASCERRTIVTTHAAFGHLAERYGLRQEAIVGIAPEAEPDPARLDELAALVEREGVTTIFTESLAAPEVAETLAREAGVRTATLDPIEGLSEAQRAAGATYATVMRENLEVLRDALGCV